jgi:lycopene beta-cyclase
MTTQGQSRQIEPDYDVIMVGAGLASSLTALRLADLRPDLKLCLLEASPSADDSHTWCCFDTDLSAHNREWMGLLWANRWSGYEVRFPTIERRLSTGYNRLSAPRLNQIRQARLGSALHYGQAVAELASDHVVLADGRRINAPLILDGRGAAPSPHLGIGYQKFLGLEVTAIRPHGVTRPMIMDAAVDQIDGYRFVYVLPLNQDRLLIEDTLYSEGPDLPIETLNARILAYAAQQGWEIQTIERRETGILPITLEGRFDAYWQELGPAAPIGMKALLFHPTTGYSLPQAIHIADLIARQPKLDTASVRPMIEKVARRQWHTTAYLRLLNRMMFRAAEPDQRYRVLQRFYGLPTGLIERFYAGNLTLGDRLRILAGKPPVPLMPALKAMRPSKD